MNYTISPIGTYHSDQTEKYLASKQAILSEGVGGIIRLSPKMMLEQAVQDLEGFQRIWVIYLFNRNTNWKPKVQTPRGGGKKGLFSTRSPHRPNPIGLSCVELLQINSLEITIGKNDLLDGTPILDIKPYLPYADAFPDSRMGWVEDCPDKSYLVFWSKLSDDQINFIENETAFPFKQAIIQRLQDNPFPFPGHRIKKIDHDLYQLACKTWRVEYKIINSEVWIEKIASGYDKGTLLGLKTSKWDDVPIHRKFIEIFQ